MELVILALSLMIAGPRRALVAFVLVLVSAVIVRPILKPDFLFVTRISIAMDSLVNPLSPLVLLVNMLPALGEFPALLVNGVLVGNV